MFRPITFFCLFWLLLLECSGQVTTIDSLKKIITLSQKGEQKTFAMARLAEVYANNQRSDSCLVIAQMALQEAKNISSKKAEAMALYALGQGYKSQSHTLALTHYKKALALCRELNFYGLNPYSEDNLLLKILQEMADQYDGYQIDSSLRCRMEALLLAVRFQTHRLEAKITLQIGNSYINRGDYAKALDFYFRALELKKRYQLRDLLGEDCHRAIGYLYVTLGDFQKAKTYLYIAKKFKEFTRQGTHYEQAHLSNAYEGLNQLDSALYFAKGAVKEAEFHQVKHELGYIYMTYAKALERLGRFSAAIGWYRRGIETCLQQNNKKTLSVVCAETANLYSRMGKIDSSYYCAKEGIQVAVESNFPRGLWESSYALSRVYKIRRQADSALKYQDLAVMIKDSLFKHEKVQRVEVIEVEQRRLERARLLAQEQEKQQQKMLAIASLIALVVFLSFVYYRNFLLRRQNKALQAALLEGQTQERKRVAADLHDNLGSTLSALRWSIEAINQTKLEPTEQEVYRHVQSTIEQAYNQVRLLSHNLFPEELEKQGIWKALEQLVRKLNRTTSITFLLTLPEQQQRLTSRMEFELYSICLELINNILKHAEATEAQLVFEITGAELHLRVVDNGKGMSSPNIEGKGLRNIAERVKALDGTWKVLGNTSLGTTHLLRLPL